MTQTEIQERNKEIVLMLGFKYKNQAKHWGRYPLNNGSFLSRLGYVQMNDLKFHVDSNWLIEAFEFVQGLRLKVPNYSVAEYYIISFGSTFCSIRSGLNHADGETKSPFFYESVSLGKNLKESMFIAVSDFARFYNRTL
jgi:hypothetical protein